MGLRGPRRPSLYQHHQISSHQLIFTLAAWPEEGGGGWWWILGRLNSAPTSAPRVGQLVSSKPREEAGGPRMRLWRSKFQALEPGVQRGCLPLPTQRC